MSQKIKNNAKEVDLFLGKYIKRQKFTNLIYPEIWNIIGW